MKNKIANLCMIIGVILVLASVSLLVYNRLENNKAEKIVNELMPQLEEKIKEAQKEEVQSQTKELPVAKVDGNEYIGYIYIPALELKLPVMADWSYAKLRMAPCRYAGSVKTNDMVIAAHNYARHFGSIKNLSQGAEVIFVDMNGAQIKYQVVEIELLNPTAVEDMTSGEYDLSLFTCNYSGQSRVTIRCERFFVQSD